MKRHSKSVWSLDKQYSSTMVTFDGPIYAVDQLEVN